MKPLARSASLFAAVTLLGGVLAACAASPPASPVASGPVSATVQPAPPASPDAAGTFHLDLVHATGEAVTIDVADASGTLVGAESGAPGDGASVEPYTLLVANDDPTTLRLTWVGGPCDSANVLHIDPSRRQFLLVQPECTGDAVAGDRILLLHFSDAIAAADVQATLQDGLDTPG
jgi:hypothetical protein